VSLAGSTAIRKGVASEAAKEIASLVEGKLGVDDGAAPLLIQQEAVGALVAPFDRAAERARRVQDRDVFGIGRGLLPNTATPGGLDPVDHAGIRRYPIRKVITPVPVEGAWRVAHSR
jgi:hypothetical protein